MSGFAANVLLPGTAQRKKLDQVRGQRIELEEQLQDLQDGETPITVEEAVERALAAWRLRAERARVAMSCFRSRQPGAVDDSMAFQDALLDEPTARKQLLALFKADGRGDGMSTTEQVAQIRKLKAKYAELIEQEYRLTFDLLEEGFVIEHICQLPPELLLRVADSLAT